MRLVPLSILALLAVLVTASVSSARVAHESRAQENAIELVDGTGSATFTMRGALIGSLDKGRITITDLPGGASTDILVQNAATVRQEDARTTVYTGENLRFRVFRGRWRIEIVGDGIDASAVGTGWLKLQGVSGRYSFAGGPYRAWPGNPLLIKLGD
jgi:hypothetical protein